MRIDLYTTALLTSFLLLISAAWMGFWHCQELRAKIATSKRFIISILLVFCWLIERSIASRTHAWQYATDKLSFEEPLVPVYILFVMIGLTVHVFRSKYGPRYYSIILVACAQLVAQLGIVLFVMVRAADLPPHSLAMASGLVTGLQWLSLLFAALIVPGFVFDVWRERRQKRTANAEPKQETQ